MSDATRGHRGGLAAGPGGAGRRINPGSARGGAPTPAPGGCVVRPGAPPGAPRGPPGGPLSC